VAALDQAGVPAGKIRGVLEALRAAEPATVTVTHPTAGEVELVAPPFALDDAPLGRLSPPPRLGEHTREVLAELGLGQERIADLEARGVVAQAP
jgi:crotonobetainyl-CoA:carnitine CoA-transferase CaiB-like acyl-CoA transferase